MHNRSDCLVSLPCLITLELEALNCYGYLVTRPNYYKIMIKKPLKFMVNSARLMVETRYNDEPETRFVGMKPCLNLLLSFKFAETTKRHLRRTE